jgi:hypothetical protein
MEGGGAMDGKDRRRACALVEAVDILGNDASAFADVLECDESLVNGSWSGVVVAVNERIGM